MKFFAIFVRLAVAALLLVAAITKWSDFAAFEDSMRLSMLFPFRFRPLLAQGIISLEMFIGVWLIFGWRLRAPAYAACALAGLFLGYATWRFRMGIPSPCHCLGPLANLGPIQSMEFASAFWLLTAAAVLTGPGQDIQTFSQRRIS